MNEHDKKYKDQYLSVEEVAVGEKITLNLATECEPFIIRSHSPSKKTIEVARLHAELDPDFKPEFVSGGYAAHCLNQRAQKWIITDTGEKAIFKLRATRDGFFRSPFNKSSYVRKGARKFYDYNF